MDWPFGLDTNTWYTPGDVGYVQVPVHVAVGAFAYAGTVNVSVVPLADGRPKVDALAGL